MSKESAEFILRRKDQPDIIKSIIKRNEMAACRIDTGRIALIEKALERQNFQYNNPKEPVKDRIISLAKPYVRPIIRGKENKPN